MTNIKAFKRDDNFVPIQNPGLVASKTITYLSATTGATGTTTLFTITGDVAIRLYAICETDLDSDGAATIEAGIAGNTAGLIALTTATTIDDGELWKDATPATMISMPTEYLLSGTNIIQTIKTETIKAGKLTYYCIWNPISLDGNVE